MDNISQYFDHTLLKADATKAQISKLCQEAKTFAMKAVCIQPCWLPLAKELLADTHIQLCTVIGFPLGGDTTLTKAAAIDEALKNGAHELDITLNIGWFKSGNIKYVTDELKELVLMAGDATCKVIVESGLMNSDEIRYLTDIVIASGAEFIKTSTGYSPHGASVDAVKIMRQSIGESGLKIKASGGIQTADQVSEYLGLGVERFGSSHTVQILQEFT